MRNVERFKNNLSWQTRLKAFIKRPSYLYNSQYAIWVIRTTGLYFRIVYANRSEELSHLRRLPLLTLVSIEAKDFLKFLRCNQIFIQKLSINIFFKFKTGLLPKTNLACKF